MLFPADHLLVAMRREINQLSRTAAGAAEGSALQALGIALSLLEAREAGGPAKLHAQLRHLSDNLTSIAPGLAADPALKPSLDELQSGIAAARTLRHVDGLEAAWRRVASQAQGLAAAIAGSQRLDKATRDAAMHGFVTWECADLIEQLSPGEVPRGAGVDKELTLERWRDYLRARFQEPAMDVTRFQPLAGGFGKQTYLFEVAGQALNGAYVIRRDLAVTLFDNDCHRIETEYLLISAMFAAGFPAPEALWLDTKHDLLPGGHFIVMRRSPGVPGGSIFQAQGQVPQNLVEILAGILARLHSLPPLVKLGPVTDSITPELWHLPLDEVVRRYLLNWRALFLREAHLPSPAMMAMFGWLLEHIPETAGRPVLLHGDIGFHNFLFDDESLSAVLDWEFCHIGDPAEDLAYVRNTIGGAIDWEAFLAAYQAAGGPQVSPERLRFFQIWGHLRNACASNLVSAKLYMKQVDDLKGIVLPHSYIPRFLQAAQSLIQE